MPSYVNPDKCDGCKALDRPACHYICPNDLMHLDKEQGKSVNIEPDLCWECYACVKTCPQSAIDIRAYADIAPMGASITPLRGTDTIMWTVKFRDGQIKRFKLIDVLLTAEDEELTPTMKLKRSYVSNKYNGLIEDMYAGR